MPDPRSPARGPVRWLHRLGPSKPGPDQSAEWEIEHHMAELRDWLVDQGLDVEEARLEAERRFGDRRRYRASMRRWDRRRVAMERGTSVLDFWLQVLRRVARTLRRSPAFALGVATTLSLGIGANATMYGIVDRLLLRPPTGVVDADRVFRVFIERTNPITGSPTIEPGLAYPDYEDLAAHGGLSAAAFAGVDIETLGSGEGATRVRTSMVSHGIFGLLGVDPVLGRFFAEEEDAPEAVLTAVISREYWERVYAADPGVLGETLEIAGRLHTVVGVAPEGFTGVELDRVDVWLPIEATHAARSGLYFVGDCLENRHCWWMDAVVRLGEGVTVEAAEAEATSLHRAGRQSIIEEGDYPEDARVVLGSIIAARGPLASGEASVVRWLAGVSLLVLLIACANVANLFLARGSTQRREVSVRLALGVSRVRLVGQLVAEAVLLALGGGALALALTRWGGEVVRTILLPDIYFPQSALHGRVLAFTAFASVLAGVMAGLGPALQASRADVTGSLGDAARGSSGRRSRLRGALTVSQAAMSAVLLVGAGLFVRSLGEVRSLDLGHEAERLAVAEIESTESRLDAAESRRLYQEAAEVARRLPGVAAVAVSEFPFGWAFSRTLSVPGRDSLPRLSGGGPYYHRVSANYFATVGLDLSSGRGLSESDGPGASPVTVVSETMARTLWPGDDAVGQCLLIGDDPPGCTTVVGVVEDAAIQGYRDRPHMAYYLPIEQGEGPARALYVRAAGEGRDIVPELAVALRSFSPRVRFANVRAFPDILGPQARSWRLGATMFSVFGLLALLLASVGLYSVLAFDVAQRTRELGIRTALGARKGPLLRSVLLRGGRLACFGVLLGLAAAWVAAPWVTELLYEVSPRDPVVLGAVGTTLLIVGLLAGLAPGLRATRIDPIESLRAE